MSKVISNEGHNIFTGTKKKKKHGVVTVATVATPLCFFLCFVFFVPVFSKGGFVTYFLLPWLTKFSKRVYS